MIARLRLCRDDGTLYLERWGVEWKSLGGVFVHRMSAPDPGVDLHDHPWPFLALILRGGYTETRANVRLPWLKRRRQNRTGSLRLMRLDEAHTIDRLNGRTSWSLVIHGRNLRRWGFYVPHSGRALSDYRWVDSADYDRLYPHRRGLTVEIDQGLGAK